MKISYKPKSQNEKFGINIYNLIVEKYPQTFFVGGMVRDLLLGKKINDIDIATTATPEQILKVLRNKNVSTEEAGKQFGVISARHGRTSIEIATLRKETYASSRYPKISFVTRPKIDSMRRDFTVNALYFQPKTGQILDYHKGVEDIKNKTLKFIGNPRKKIKEDPLRIIRALRFSLELNLSISEGTLWAIKNNFSLVNNLTDSKVKKEIFKLKNKNQGIILKKVINSPILLDKYFKLI